MSEVRLKIYEIFYSIQGESTFAGRPCVLVRLTGCQMRCSWCDTEYAFHGGAWMGLDEVMAQVAAFGCPLVEVTGGEPLLQPGCLPLLRRSAMRGMRCCSRRGAGWISRRSTLGCGGFSTSSARRVGNPGTIGGRTWPTSAQPTRSSSSSRIAGDYDWAKGVLAERSLAGVCPIHFSPVWESCPPAELAAWILADRLPVRLTLQQHKILWGKDTRGV